MRFSVFRDFLLHRLAGEADHQQRKRPPRGSRSRCTKDLGSLSYKPQMLFTATGFDVIIKRRKFLRLDQIVDVLVERYEPRNLGLIRGEQPIQMIVDIRLQLHRALRRRVRQFRLDRGAELQASRSTSPGEGQPYRRLPLVDGSMRCSVSEFGMRFGVKLLFHSRLDSSTTVILFNWLAQPPCRHGPFCLSASDGRSTASKLRKMVGITEFYKLSPRDERPRPAARDPLFAARNRYNTFSVRCPRHA